MKTKVPKVFHHISAFIHLQDCCAYRRTSKRAPDKSFYRLLDAEERNNLPQETSLHGVQRSAELYRG